MNRIQSILFCGALLVLYLAGVGVRRHVLTAQYPPAGTLPFTLESALQFRTVRHIYEHGCIPRHDPALQYPEGVVPAEVDTLGAEYVYAAMAHGMPGTWPLEDRVRWAELLWFCLGIPLMGLWVRGITGSGAAGITAALFYAVMPAAVVRSTGQEISHENFALPLLLAHLAAAAWAARQVAWRPAYGLAALSALALALALTTWDMIQFYLYLWMAVQVWRLWRGEFRSGRRGAAEFLLHLCALLLAAVANPYLRAHGFWLAPVMLLGYGVTLGMLVDATRLGGGRGRWALLLAALVLPGLLLAAGGGVYQESYQHFGELVWAKIVHLNQKPADPAVLTFNQRILWVPALNSATWRLTWDLFPATLFLSLGALVARGRYPWSQPGAVVVQPAIFYGASLVAFGLFARFHVYLALFTAALLGCWAVGGARRARWRWLVFGLLAAGVVAEAGRTIRDPRRWGRPGVYYDELGELAARLNQQADKGPVLANFGVSAYILAYANYPVILHPKFEQPGLRDRVAGYGTALFKGPEHAFRDWADALGARYYVHALGEFATAHPELQMRYFVDALVPPTNAAARLFEFRPDDGRYFRYLWGNRKYRVFRLLTREDEAAAAGWARQARAALQEGRLDLADELAWRALAMDRHNRAAQQTVAHVASLKEQGFEYDDSNGAAGPGPDRWDRLRQDRSGADPGPAGPGGAGGGPGGP